MPYQITVTIGDEMLRDVARSAVENIFSKGSRWEPGGTGYAEVYRQVNQFARAQDYGDFIREVFPGVLSGVVRDALAEAVKAEVKKQVKVMKDTGQLKMEVDGA